MIKEQPDIWKPIYGVNFADRLVGAVQGRRIEPAKGHKKIESARASMDKYAYKQLNK